MQTDATNTVRACPLVSVVITCYNHGRFLSEAIESALSQSYAPVEVIVVDDGSTDDTPEVAARHPGVRTVRQPNLGLSAARNTGIHEAQGDYLIFLDADDRLRPNAVEAGLACFESRPGSAFVSGDHIRINTDGALIGKHEPPEDDPDAYLRLLRMNYIGMHATVMYRREALVASGGFDTTLPACEDYDMYLRIAQLAPVASHEAIVAEYRIHDWNMSHNAVFMLHAAQHVLQKQETTVQGDPQREAAYRDGFSNWKAYYGRVLLSQLRHTIQARGPLRSVPRLIFSLVYYAPLEIPRAGLRLIRQLARRYASSR